MRNSDLFNRISQRIRIYIQNHFRLWIRGPDRYFWCKKTPLKISCLGNLKQRYENYVWRELTDTHTRRILIHKRSPCLCFCCPILLQEKISTTFVCKVLSHTPTHPPSPNPKANILWCWPIRRENKKHSSAIIGAGWGGRSESADGLPQKIVLLEQFRKKKHGLI
jgi:hypothetical protein